MANNNTLTTWTGIKRLKQKNNLGSIDGPHSSHSELGGLGDGKNAQSWTKHTRRQPIGSAAKTIIQPMVELRLEYTGLVYPTTPKYPTNPTIAPNYNPTASSIVSPLGHYPNVPLSSLTSATVIKPLSHYPPHHPYRPLEYAGPADTTKRCMNATNIFISPDWSADYSTHDYW